MPEPKSYPCSPNILIITTHLLYELPVLRMEQRVISSCFYLSTWVNPPPRDLFLLQHFYPQEGARNQLTGFMSCKSGWRLILCTEGSSIPRPDWKFSLFPSWKYWIFLPQPDVFVYSIPMVAIRFSPHIFPCWPPPVISLLIHPTLSLAPYSVVNKVGFSVSSRTTSPQLQSNLADLRCHNANLVMCFGKADVSHKFSVPGFRAVPWLKNSKSKRSLPFS